MSKKSRLARPIHFTVAFIGGFLGMYTIVNFSSLFGSAQTANLICLVTSLLDADWGEMLLRLGGLFLYMAAIALTELLFLRTSLDLRLISLCIDGAAALMTGFFPPDLSPILCLYPMFFSMAFQWNSFSSAKGFPSSTIFSTNNVRQFTLAVTEFCVSRDPACLGKIQLFGGTLLAFHSGVAAAYLLWRAFRGRTSWFCLVPIAAAIGMVLTDQRRSQPCKTA